MSRIYKKLIPEESEERFIPHLPEKPRLFLVPPPPTAEMRSPLPRKKIKFKKRFLVLSLLVFFTAGAYFRQYKPAPKRLVGAQTAEKYIPIMTPSLTEDEGVLVQKEALARFEKKDYKAAKTAFESLVENYPDSPELLNNLGLTYLRLDEVARAKKFFLKALKLKPRDAKTLNNLGTFYLAQNDLKQAISYLKAATASQPELLEARLNLGKAFEMSERALDAVPEYEAYIQSRQGDMSLKGHLRARVTKIKSFASYYEKYSADSQ